ncbi:excinuclease ABC subunit UvrA [Streptomyces sp. NPDC004528]|uniref:excinuclease ABC subunit UvrA n=1 Tax=Streptomyces sp. NPDC004528 TaxID=3154550 RepID=UPI0033A3318E
MTHDATDPFVHVRGAGENNLRNVDVDVPQDAMVAFTGVSGSGKSSLAFGTLYAEAQRRYFESVAPYARRLLQQVGAPHVQEITGLPPAVALQQRRGSPSSRSTVGTLTTLSNLLRILYSRAGTYPPRAARLEAESFSPNTPAGACPRCHGLGVVHDVAEDLLVPDPSLSIREGAIAAWPGAWQGANLRSVVNGLGIDIDRPWRRLRKKDRDWLLYTDEQPSVYIEPEADRVDYGYQGTFWSARKHVMHVLADSKSERMRERALRFVRSVPCPACHGSGLRSEALAVTFAGRSIAEVNAMPLSEAVELLRPVRRRGADPRRARRGRRRRRTAPSAIGWRSAGAAPRRATAEPLLDVLDRLKAAGNSLFVVEHDMDVVRRADWVVDIGPGAGEGGGRVLYSGPVAGLERVEESATSQYLFGRAQPVEHRPRTPHGWLRLSGVSRHNLHDVSVDVPLCVLTAVTGVSGSGKSTLVTQVLAEVVRGHLGLAPEEPDEAHLDVDVQDASGVESFDRLVRVDQRPIGRTPRSNLATYTGMFDAVRKLYAATDEARARGYSAGRFSFNVPEGRCETCQGEGFVAVELLFLPGTYAPCPTCDGARYNAETLEVTYRGKNIADVLALSVDAAATFLSAVPSASRSLETLREVGLGYLRLGQPATELSGGEAQRIKLATELQRARRGHALYLLDEPTAGLHPADIALLLRQLHRLVDAGNTVVLVEHDLDTIATADWVIDLGPGGGDTGGKVVAAGPPAKVARARGSATARYLAARLSQS